jgi:hypothetical protein
MGRTMDSPLVWNEPVDDDDPFVNEEEVVDPPFQDKDTYWCNACAAYRKEFYPSSIARRMRQCRPCKNKKRKSRVQSHLSKLRSRLFKAFNRRGFKGHRAVFREKSTLVQLIKSRGLSVKAVVAIVPPKDEADVSNMQAYGFTLRPTFIENSYKIDLEKAV